MTDKKHRGMDAKINHCMWSFVEYAAKCRPVIAVFESVRPAFSNGRPMMVKLREKLEEMTGLRYNLHHVMHNAYDLGGAALRSRYFWVASQIPFGVNYPHLKQLPVLEDVIGDLTDHAITWSPQLYRRPQSWWTKQHHVLNPAGTVDGHMTRGGLATDRALDLLEMATERLGGWPPNWHIGKLAKHVWEQTGELPKSWDHLKEKLPAIDFHMGFTSLTRWDMKRPGRVITGGALTLVLHPTEPRTITHREAARVMGFPDSWVIEPLRKNSGLPLTWGKGITVQCGKWIGEQVINALNGNPGLISGTEIGDREYYISSTNGVPKTTPRVRPVSLPVIMNESNQQDEVTDPECEELYMSEPTGAPEGAEAAVAGGKRGRPRPEATKERDAQVLALIDGPKTREQLAEELTAQVRATNPDAEAIKPGLVYLSLYRLRRDNKVTVARGENGKQVWSVAAAV